MSEPIRSGPAWDHAKLRAWREEAGLRRERVAADLEISYPWLVILEHGTGDRTPSLDILTRLAHYYGHEPGELLMTTGATP